MSLIKPGNHVISVEISTSLRNLCVPHGGKRAKCVKEKIIFPKCVNRTKPMRLTIDEEYDSSSSYEEHSTLVVELEQPDESCTNSVREVNALSNGYERKILANMQLRGNPPTDITMQVDCGATCNVIPERYLPPDCTITSTNMRLSLYNKEYMEIEGIAKLHLRNPKNQKKYLVHFAVVKGQKTMLPLIGSHTCRPTAQQMGLIKIQYENIERPKSDGKQTSAPRANVNKKSSANDK